VRGLLYTCCKSVVFLSFFILTPYDILSINLRFRVRGSKSRRREMLAIKEKKKPNCLKLRRQIFPKGWHA